MIFPHIWSVRSTLISYIVSNHNQFLFLPTSATVCLLKCDDLFFVNNICLNGMQYCIDLFQADIVVQKATNINHSKWTAMQKKKKNFWAPPVKGKTNKSFNEDEFKRLGKKPFILLSHIATGNPGPTLNKRVALNRIGSADVFRRRWRSKSSYSNNTGSSCFSI